MWWSARKGILTWTRTPADILSLIAIALRPAVLVAWAIPKNSDEPSVVCSFEFALEIIRSLRCQIPGVRDKHAYRSSTTPGRMWVARLRTALVAATLTTLELNKILTKLVRRTVLISTEGTLNITFITGFRFNSSNVTTRRLPRKLDIIGLSGGSFNHHETKPYANTK